MKKGFYYFCLSIAFLVLFGLIILRSVAPYLFPLYYLYIAAGIVLFLFFSQIDFEVFNVFSLSLYIASLVFLLLPLVVGQVSRGAVRWLSVGSKTIQPAEIVRPFLFLFFAKFLTQKRLSRGRLFGALVIALTPLAFILLQPSLGVAALTAIGFFGIIIASGVDKKLVLGSIFVGILSIPVVWLILAPYQKQRVTAFLHPGSDPSGQGYNSIQSMISVGSGKFWGRGLGEGVQTQLFFLPERHTDFIFASVAEEMGFIGAVLLMFGSFYLLFLVGKSIDRADSFTARSFIAGVFVSFLAQTAIHIGMNMGMFPITGLPLPLVSAGGSSLVATMMTLGMVVSATR